MTQVGFWEYFDATILFEAAAVFAAGCFSTVTSLKKRGIISQIQPCRSDWAEMNHGVAGKLIRKMAETVGLKSKLASQLTIPGCSCCRAASDSKYRINQ